MEILAKSFLRFVGFLILFAFVGADAVAESLPKYRPALLGQHKRSLVNLINTQSLMKRGQGDAIVMFEAGISRLGGAYDSRTYRETPNSEALKSELLGRLDQAQFEPAVYNHARVAVYIQGTASFAVRDGKPQLRIFLHQEEEYLKSGADFIAPQLAFIPGNTAYKGFRSPPGHPGRNGRAMAQVNVDAIGKVQGVKVISEHPPGMGFGAATAGPLRDAMFIPGFRNGKPVASQFSWAMVFTRPGLRMEGIF